MNLAPSAPTVPALLFAALCAGFVMPGVAASGRDTSVNMEQIVNSEAFLSAHPDMRWRRKGMQAYDLGQYGFAANYFRRAAQYADKPSQAMYAEMLWEGLGVEQDRELAYAWMDLAAERGYPGFLAKRERYWASLDRNARRRAIERGRAVYAEYGDEVAKPRQEAVLQRQTRRGVTGSRVGAVTGKLEVILPSSLIGWQQTSLFQGGIAGEDYYQDRYWQPRAYWAWQDRTWGLSRTGDATVGDLEALDRKQERNGDPP